MTIFEFNEKLLALKEAAAGLRGNAIVSVPEGKGRVYGYVVIGYELDVPCNEIRLFTWDGPNDTVTLIQAISLLNGGKVDMGHHTITLMEAERFNTEMAEVRQRFAATCKALTGKVIHFAKTVHDDANDKTTEIYETLISEAIISPDTQPGEIPDSLELHASDGKVGGYSLGTYGLDEANALLKGYTVNKTSWAVSLVSGTFGNIRHRLIGRKLCHKHPGGLSVLTIKDVTPAGQLNGQLMLALHGENTVVAEQVPYSRASELLDGKPLKDINPNGDYMWLEPDEFVGECYRTHNGVFRVTEFDSLDGTCTVMGIEDSGNGNVCAYASHMDLKSLDRYEMIPVGVYMDYEAAIMKQLRDKSICEE